VMGLPIITTNWGGSTEFVTEESGLLINVPKMESTEGGEGDTHTQAALLICLIVVVVVVVGAQQTTGCEDSAGPLLTWTVSSSTCALSTMTELWARRWAGAASSSCRSSPLTQWPEATPRGATPSTSLHLLLCLHCLLLYIALIANVCIGADWPPHLTLHSVDWLTSTTK
jgi:hypothetical protein